MTKLQPLPVVIRLVSQKMAWLVGVVQASIDGGMESLQKLGQQIHAPTTAIPGIPAPTTEYRHQCGSFKHLKSPLYSMLRLYKYSRKESIEHIHS